MCRIAAIISKNVDTIESRITAMTEVMHRGGPDDSGHSINKDLNFALGHRRLAIIDISPSGHQPMIDDSGDIEIVFNGEIYNYKILKEELQKLGHFFKTESDTEVLIKGYKQWGQKLLLNKIRGMYAFVLIDLTKNILFGARDHAGIKPLYIGRRKDDIYFSSEIKGLKAADVNWEENKKWPIWFLSYGFLPEPITSLENVKPLPRGHYITINLETRKEEIVSYCKYEFKENNIPYSEAVKKTKELLDESIKRHLIADVQVGVFLSGGIDSSILTIAAQQQLSSPIETLGIYFDDEKFSEKKYQDIIVKQTGVKHHSYKVTKEDFLNAWDDIYESLDQPTTDAINTYFLSKFAKQNGLKVVLSGLGADEIFGGYPSINRAPKIKTYQRIAVINKILQGCLLGSSYPKKKIEFLNKKINNSEYLLYRGLFTPSDTAKILNVDVNEVWEELSKLEYQERIDNLNPQNKATYFETAIYMQNQLLKDSDMQSMWHSLELRVPFLDRDLMEFINNLHPSVKFPKNQQKPKPLLVDAYINEVPEAIWNRPKKGFTFPFESWFQSMDLLNNPKNLQPYIYKKFLDKKINFSRVWSAFIVNKSIALESSKAINVVHFQRKRHKYGNHSIESIFKTVRDLSPSNIKISVQYPRFISKGLFQRMYNSIEAVFRQKDINHITGDIHFINFLLTVKKNILTIHDCGSLKRSSGLKHKILKLFWYTIPAKKSTVITVNSNYTKQDLLTYIDYPENNIKVIYVFVPSVHKPYFKEFNKAKPIILQLGTAENKNIPRVAKALKGINCKYVILGKMSEEIESALDENEVEYDNISTSITDEAVADLYRKCDIVSFVSTFEGFGMPIAEANATGRVVVTSNTSSMLEIAGNAAEIIDPFDIQSIRNGFLKVINDDLYRDQLIKNGFENVKRFDKKVIANQYFQLYNQIATNN